MHRLSSAAVCTMIALAVFLVGCAKKKPQTPVKQAASQVQEPAKQDVFDEFYQAEPISAVSKREKASKDETFSTKTTVSSRKTSSYGSSASSIAFAEDGRYVVQVGCVASASAANRKVEQLKAQGYPAYAAEVDNPTPELSGRYYRIRIGGFSGVSAARHFGETSFGQEGYWVDNKSNDHVGMEGYGLGSSAPAGRGYTASTSASSEWSSTPASSDAGLSLWNTTPAENTPTSSVETPAAAAPVTAPSSSAAGASTASSDTASGKGGGWGDDGWGSSGDAGW